MKICFLSLSSYPLLAKKNLSYVGGAEVQQVYIGRELMKRGYDVCFITYYHGERQTENLGGIEVIKTYEREKHKQMSVLSKYISLWFALKKARADIYFHSTGSPQVLPLFCFLNRKNFIRRISSDSVVLSNSISGNYGFIRKSSDIIEIKRANMVVSQSNFQRKILKERVGIESVVIKNGLIISENSCVKQDPPVILWVGSVSSVKRPHLFIELAKSIPYVNFEMIGGKNKTDPQLYDEIKVAAKKVKNLTFRGFVPYHEINEHFRKASIFVNTSSVEGFPNTFLQAWMHNVPVVSLNVDPDNVIKKNFLGFCAKTFEHLITGVTNLIEDEKLRRRLGKIAGEYVKQEHDIVKTTTQYVKMFESMQKN